MCKATVARMKLHFAATKVRPKSSASLQATGPPYNVVSGVAPVRPRGPSTMSRCTSVQVSCETAFSNSNPRVSKSSREWVWEEVSSENHIFEISGEDFKILNAKRVVNFEMTFSLETSSKKLFRAISKLSGSISKWRSRPRLPHN